jgi:hypothetical protein
MNTRIIAAVVVAFALGCYWSSSSPQPWTPHNDRPWATWVARTAKRLLWIVVVAEPPPGDQEPAVEARVGADGYRVVQHTKGW